MTQKTDRNKIRVGVVGVGRGMSFANGAPFVGMELVALCDTWDAKLHEAGKKLNVTTYTDYDQFLAHEMDAVVLANYFHQHAPFAVKALEAGLNVMTETMACGTPAEGVALARAVETSLARFFYLPKITLILPTIRRCVAFTRTMRLASYSTPKGSTTTRSIQRATIDCRRG